MKKKKLNYFQCVMLIMFVSGVNPINKLKLLDNDGKAHSLLKEEISQGTKTRLNRSLKNITELFNTIEKSRAELMKNHGITKDNKDNFEAYTAQFKELTAELFDVEIDIVDINKVSDFVSKIDYTAAIEILAE